MEPTQNEKDSFVSRLTEIIESNLSNEQFGVTELAREMGMSRSSLHRKVKAVTNITISQFLCQVRLKKALELLRESSISVTEVAIECGFNSPSYFTKCFKKYYGVPPSKFNKIKVTVSFPADAGIPQDISKPGSIKKSHLWTIIAILILISTVLFVLILVPGKSNPAKEKTIAVLPVRNFDPDTENAFLVDGLMNEIRYKLSLSGDLTVLSRTTVESYRNNTQSAKEIGKELNVDYILECKVLTIQGNTRVGLQLMDIINNANLWSEPLERELSLKTIFEVQKEVALAVFKELKSDLTPENKELMDRIPTEDITAYNLFLLGKNYTRIHKYGLDKKSSGDAIIKAKLLFKQAIELDSSFADAYSALGSIYLNYHYKMSTRDDLDKKREYLDSALIFLDKALFYDSENLLALKMKAEYYEKTGLHEDAKAIYDKLSKHESFNYEYYEDEVMKFPHIKDYYGTLSSYQKYLALKPEELIASRYMIRKLYFVFLETGYPEQGKRIAEHLYGFNKDSAMHLRRLVSLELSQGNYQTALDLALKAVKLDSSRIEYCDLIALCYVYLEEHKNALDYLVLTDDSIRRNGPIVRPGYIPGYIYLVNGYETQANFHFRRGIERRLKEIEYQTPEAQQGYSHFDLAGIYLAQGNEEKALDYLKELKNLKAIDHEFIHMMLNWPGFESIRERPEFLDVLAYLEYNFQKQHKRIGALIENMDMDQLLLR